MSPPRPSRSPLMQERIQPYFKVEVLGTTPKALLNLDHFTERFRAGLHRLLSRQSRAGSSLWQKGRALQAGPGEQEGLQSHTPGAIFVLSISLCLYPNIILAICKIPHVQL